MTSPPDPFARRRRALLVLGTIIVVILFANLVAADLTSALDVEIRPSNEDLVHRLIMASSVAYTLLLALPFVPGVELGLAIIGVLGTKIVPLVYLCTLVGLTASFALGRLIGLESLARLGEDIGLARTATLLRRVESLDSAARLEFLVGAAPSRIVPFLLRHRYLAFAAALNLPGNFLLGGGGGLALIAGVSGLYSPVRFIATTAMAISPLPIAIVLFGSTIVGG